MRLIIDENLPPRWCDYLAPHGVSANHWPEIGPALMEILNKHRDQLLSGCLITLDHQRHRVRLLPLR